MSRRGWISVAICLVGLATIVVGTVREIQKERAQVVDAFTQDRLDAVKRLAAEVDRDFAHIQAVLKFTGRLFLTAENDLDRRRELTSLVTVVEQYRAVVVFDAEGKALLEVADPRDDPSSYRAEIAEEARRALESPPDQILASAPFTVDNSAWFRIFAMPFAADEGRPIAGVVALLVDTQPLFGKVRLIAGSTQSRLLILGAHGLPAPASTPALAQALSRLGPGLPRFTALVEQMRAGEPSGTLAIGDKEAFALGLDRAPAVAAYAAIPYRGGHWSVATVDSTAALADHEHAIVTRLGLAAAGVGLLLVTVAAWIVRAARQRTALEMTEKIVENVPAGVLALSAEGKITSLNRALRDRLSADATPLGSGLRAAFVRAPDAVIARMEGLLAAAIADGKVHSLLGEHLPLFGVEGRYSLHAVPLEPRFPEARVLLVIDDLSEVRSLESRLLRAEKLATVGVLAAGIAHEIGTPLGVARGRAEYVLGKLEPESPHARGLAVTIDQIDHVSRTIRQLLDFARVKPAAVRPAQVGPAVRAVLELLKFEAERCKVELRAEVPDDLPPIAADPDQLQQVLVNLVMNACDACDGKGGRVTVRALAAGDAVGWAAVRIDVVDDGCGIPEDLVHQVFDPFFTTKKRGQGTGLGLTICSQIVRNHGGDIELDSTVGKGTRVTLFWPARGAEEARAHG